MEKCHRKNENKKTCYRSSRYKGFSLSWYDIFMAPDPIILFGVLVRSNGKFVLQI
ncbi:hypothetical protein [Peribacillus frigoritolerans]|uniref:hypothetical protein n=1 Tax=Peribacillus frigoritolerans TaxID=450367 RepID=UPI0032E48075